MKTGFQEKKQKIFNDIKNVLDKDPDPMTVRQVYYQLVSWFKYKPTEKTYNSVKGILCDARKKYGFDCNRIIDASRSLVQFSVWNDVADFIDTVKNSYNKDKWVNQKECIQVWIEKDALVGVIEPVCRKYNVPFLSGKGGFSISSLNEAQKIFPKDKQVRILYFGDLDPAGVIKIERGAVVKNLAQIFSQSPIVERVSLTLDDVRKYKLPQDYAKKKDTSYEEYVKEFGDIAVELDALPSDILRQKVEDSILEHLDIEQFNKDLEIEKEDINKINKLIDKE